MLEVMSTGARHYESELSRMDDDTQMPLLSMYNYLVACGADIFFFKIKTHVLHTPVKGKQVGSSRFRLFFNVSQK